MRWRGRRTSDNVVDVRRGGGGGGGFGGGPGRIGGIGLVIVLIAGAFFGVDLTPFLQGGGTTTAPGPAPTGPNAIDDEAEEFVAVVLADTEEVWSREFAARGATYQPPRLFLFSGSVTSACGQASSAVGPFYCPGDSQVYLDLDFFRVMRDELGARGEFAFAYVIAHEVGHHVQNQTGVMRDTASARARASESEANEISVRVELQADCYSGVWARGAEEMFGTLEPGDIESALDTAARIGDDALQRRSQGVVVPDSFTHGSSAQRQDWFGRGYKSGTMESCDTFSGRI